MRTPDGAILVDPTGRVAGRGAYVCHQDACIERAITKGALARALETTLPSDVRATLLGAIDTDTLTEGGARGQE